MNFLSCTKILYYCTSCRILYFFICFVLIALEVKACSFYKCCTSQLLAELYLLTDKHLFLFFFTLHMVTGMELSVDSYCIKIWWEKSNSQKKLFRVLITIRLSFILIDVEVNASNS